MSLPVGIGIDVGSQGVRVLAARLDGQVLATAREGWPLERDQAGAHEQDPMHWWAAIERRLREVCQALAAEHRAAVTGISATATSGTVLVTDEQLRPLRPALMWDDKRAVAEAEDCAAFDGGLSAELGYRFRPTFSLPKLVWIRRHEPSVWERTRHVAHATDWLTSQLSGRTPPTCDYTNALKSGYDLIRQEWPAYVEAMGVPHAILPPVVAAGTPVGPLDSQLATHLGLAPSTRVVAGMTDANTAQVTGGAYDVGQWVTTIGTGLSLKGVSRSLVKDPRGVLYCHRHPDGYWIPTGTSHSGADAIALRFPEADLARLTAAAAARGPADALVFPLPRPGEFFPFWAPEAEGFVLGEVADDVDLFRAHLEGIAFVERLSHEVISGLGAQIIGPVTTVGGGSRSELWRQIRADVLGRPVRAARHAETAFGAAIVALSPDHGGIAATARSAVEYLGESEPRADSSDFYDGRYGRFVDALVDRGYLDRSVLAGRNT